MRTDTKAISDILGIPPLGSDVNREIEYLLTDSRSLSVAEFTLFFAIPSASRDGADYIGELYARGVRTFVTTHTPENLHDFPDGQFFVVPDPVKSLQKIASRHSDFHGTMVAVTGSRGKTTLKEWIFQLMEPLTDIIRSPRSYNSRIGVPLSLWEIAPSTRLAIIEAGVSKEGEMEVLAECIRPDITIITNIGDAHAEGFSSIQKKSEEKSLLAAYPSVQTVIFNADSKYPRDEIMQMCAGKRLIGWSMHSKDAPLYIRADDNSDCSKTIKYTYRVSPEREISGEFTAPVSSEAEVENLCHALAFMLTQEVAPDVISKRMAMLHKIGTRLNVSEGINNCSVIYDSYTSDFSSLRPAMDFMRRRTMPDMTPVLILSDMLHESESDTDLYTRIARLVEMAGIKSFIGIGPGMCAHSSLLPQGSHTYISTEEFLSKVSLSDFTDNIILLKGAPQFGFEKILQLLEARTHETVLEVNLDSLIKNYNYFRSQVPSGTGMIAMVKAFGYGAGSYEIAKTLQDCGASYLAVAVLDEGMDLRRKRITMPIMVMNPKVVNYKAMFANSLEPEIYTLSMLDDVVREAERCGVHRYPVHIKLDTGMHRMGFSEGELPAVMDLLESQDFVEARSVFTHLATADSPDMDDYTLLQLNRFKKYSDYMLQRSKHPIMRHVLNSAGILRFPQYHYDMVRLGIGLYGANTLPESMEKRLAVVSTLRTVIITIREWKAGETVGYGRRGVLKRDSRIATIPIGYADGMNRHFGCGAISVKVNGKDAPTVGNICMDACMIDVTDIHCKEGDAVEIFGTQADVQRLADALGTIPYEILTSVSPRVKRLYYRE